MIEADFADQMKAVNTGKVIQSQDLEREANFEGSDERLEGAAINQDGVEEEKKETDVDDETREDEEETKDLEGMYGAGDQEF